MSIPQFSEWAIKTNVIHHMEPTTALNGGYISTYGSYEGNITAYDMVIDKSNLFHDKPVFRSNRDSDKGYIMITTNLLKQVRDTKKYTITFWMLVSDIKSNTLIYPYSGCVYDSSYHTYHFDNCKPIHEFRLESDLLVYSTENYSSGVYRKELLPNNRWSFITITVDTTSHTQNRMRMYINGELKSLGYTHESDVSIFGLETDVWNISNGCQNRWEFPGYRGAEYYAISEFTIYKDCLDHIERFVPPSVSTSEMLQLTLTNKTFLNDNLLTGSIDLNPISPDINDDGVCINIVDSRTATVDIPLDFQRDIKKYAIFTDDNNWASCIKQELLTGYTPTYTIQPTQSNTISPSKGLVDSINTSMLLIKNAGCDFVLLQIGYHDTCPIQETMDNVIEIVENLYNNSIIPVIVGYARARDNSEKEFHLWNLHMSLTRYWYRVDRPPLFYYVNTYSIPDDLDNPLTESYYAEDSIYLSQTGSVEYTKTIKKVIDQIANENKFYIYPKESLYNIHSSLIIQEFPFSQDIDFTLEVEEPEIEEPEQPPEEEPPEEEETDTIIDNTELPIEIEIPYPYPSLKEDTPFFLVAPDGRFIPEVEYVFNEDRTKIRFYNGKNPYNAQEDDDFRFIFVHKHGMFSIRKIEVTIETQIGQYSYKFDSPYPKVVDLNNRVSVYYNGSLLPKYSGFYTFLDSGYINLSSSLLLGEGNKITLLCFYNESTESKFVPSLPVSGYIEFNRTKIDRVWDKDLFAIFLNGKLVSRNDILDLSSDLHKITKDLETRYNLDIVNMSPTISFITPLIKTRYERKVKHIVSKEIASKINVHYSDVYKPRPFLDPAIVAPIELKPVLKYLDPHPEFYITILRHPLEYAEKNSDLTYTLKFYKDCYTTVVSRVMVILQLRWKSVNRELLPDSKTRILMTTLASTLKQNTTLHVSTKISDLIIKDTDSNRYRIDRPETIYDNDIESTMVVIPEHLPEDIVCTMVVTAADPEYSGPIDSNKDINSSLIVDSTETSSDIESSILVEVDTTTKLSDMIDGMMIRFELEKQVAGKIKKVYYELVTDNYEYTNQVGVFDIIISTGSQGTGDILYKKTVYLLPFGSPNFKE